VTVDVWSADAASLESALTPLTGLLSCEEQRQLGAFRSGAARRLFLASRVLQRLLGARYLGCDPREVTITRHCPRHGDGDHGRPRLTHPAGPDFSVSHSGRLVVLAYTFTGRVGVDVEEADRPVDAGLMGRLVLSPQEEQALAEAPEPERPGRFRRIWTRKEAVLKLTGHGLGVPLSRLWVDTVDDIAQIGDPPADWPTASIQLRDFPLIDAVGGRYVATVATTDGQGRVRVHASDVTADVLSDFRLIDGNNV